MFADAFRRHVGPILRSEAWAQAWLVVLGHRSFDDAHEHVWETAIQRGALRLPPRDMCSWEQWIAAEILEAEVALTPALQLYAQGSLG